MHHKYVEVNNPGGGDCGFYSFAIGLIPLLQQELGSNNNRLFNKLLPYVEINKQEDFIKNIKDFDISQKNVDFLSQFNLLLRKILHDIRIKGVNHEFKDDYTIQNGEKKFTKFVLKDDFLFSDAMAIFWHFYDNSASEDAYDNELFRNKEVREKLQEIAKEVNRLEKASGNKLNDDEKGANVRAYLFMDTEEVDNDAKFSDKSIVGQTLKENSKPGKWATENDLRLLAEEFNLCLVFQGIPFYIPHNDNRPVIRINHPSQIHWTTLYDLFPAMGEDDIPDESIYKYEIYAKSVKLTTQEIIAVLQPYTKNDGVVRKFSHFFHNSRRHVGLADEIIQYCEQDPKIEEIIKYIRSQSADIDYNPKDDFADRVNYICYRFNGKKAISVEKEVELQEIKNTTTTSNSNIPG